MRCSLSLPDAVQDALVVPVANGECHLYFARRVTFLSYADTRTDADDGAGTTS